MSQNSKIEWTEKTWNPVTGCTKVSQGCKNCYAEVIANRFWKDRKFSDVICHSDRLEQPLHWRKPAKVFVNSMSDLFHESVPFEFIDKVFAVMALCPQHTFQILTKRPERAVHYFSNRYRSDDYNYNAHILSNAILESNFCGETMIKFHLSCDTDIKHYVYNQVQNNFPLKNVWIGVSVEDQATADERIPLLLQIPAAVRFLSCEPLLGEIDLKKYLDSCSYYCDHDTEGGGHRPGVSPIHWVICGGESGHGARPMHPAWARKLRDDCKSAGVPFFFKQWGEWIDIENMSNVYYKQLRSGEGINWKINNFQFVGDSRIFTLHRLGKKAAGRHLDGVEHNEFPLHTTGND